MDDRNHIIPVENGAQNECFEMNEWDYLRVHTYKFLQRYTDTRLDRSFYAHCVQVLSEVLCTDSIPSLPLHGPIQTVTLARWETRTDDFIDLRGIHLTYTQYMKNKNTNKK